MLSPTRMAIWNALAPNTYWRWKVQGLIKDRYQFPQPNRERPNDLSGRRILLHSEQGIWRRDSSIVR